MNKVITKLNNLKNPESFIQVNTIKGYKYVDLAGEIVNAYHDGDVSPAFTMNLNGLVLDNPTDKVEQLKITASTIWLKSSEIDSLDMVATIFSKESKKILDILKIEHINRIGWRNYFVYEFSDEKEQIEYLKKFTILKETKPVSINLTATTEKGFDINLSIKPVEKNDGNKTKGVMFDVDIYKNEKINTEKIPQLLREFRNYLSDKEGFLNMVNETFK